MEDTYEIDLREIFGLIKNRLAVIICCTIACAAIAVAATIFLMPEKFQSDATLIVNTRDAATSATVTNDQINSAKQLVDTYAVILKSDTVMDTVIEKLNLTSVEGFEEVTAKTLAEDIVTIAQVDSTQVMRISAVTTNADLSTDIVTEIVNLAPDMIINTVKAGSVEIISAPKAQDEKVSPSLTKNTAIGGMLGLVISMGSVVLSGLLDRTFKSDEDIVRHLELPVLGVIPDVEKKHGREKK